MPFMSIFSNRLEFENFSKMSLKWRKAYLHFVGIPKPNFWKTRRSFESPGLSLITKPNFKQFRKIIFGARCTLKSPSMLWSNNVCLKGQKYDVIEFFENSFLLFHSKLYLMTFNILFLKNFFPPDYVLILTKCSNFHFVLQKNNSNGMNKHLVTILRFLNRPRACVSKNLNSLSWSIAL